MITDQRLVEATRFEELENELRLLRQALDLGHIEAAKRLVHNMTWTIEYLKEK